MSAIPQPQHSTVAAIFAAYEKAREAEPERAYLGASEIGHPCARALWLKFRWAEIQRFEGRMLRLFDHGNVEEARIIADLRRVGCTVWNLDPATGEQWRYKELRGHFSGGLDGVVTGLKEAPKTPHLLECKTHNAASFRLLQKGGVGASKPGHLAQMQVLCKLASLSRWCYVAVCKDTDAIYLERGEFDPHLAERWFSRAHEIIFSSEPPDKISDSPDWHECQNCAFRELCHGTAAPRPTCRTCAHATPVDNGAWHCARWQNNIPLAAQREGCPEHRYIPALVASFAELDAHDEDSNVTTWRILKGAQPRHIRQPEWSSWEIRNTTDKAMLGEQGIEDLKREFEGAPRVGWDDFPSDLPWLEKGAA